MNLFTLNSKEFVASNCPPIVKKCSVFLQLLTAHFLSKLEGVESDEVQDYFV